MMNHHTLSEKSFTGCLLGLCIGDVVGLPYEGLSAKQMAHHQHQAYHPALLWCWGMMSDDTEQNGFVAAALIQAHDDPHRFATHLARSLRWWLLALPAGVGFASLRSGLKLWLGFSPARSGVFSAGNGAAMRCALIGLYYADDVMRLQQFIRASTNISHRDPKAYYGALVIALAVRHSATESSVNPVVFLQHLQQDLDAADHPAALELMALLQQAYESAHAQESVGVFAQRIGCKNGISGYMYHSVPCVLQTWFRYPDDYRAGIEALISAGGDTDTHAAILGGIVGARVGTAGIPADWLQGLWEYPRHRAWLTARAKQVYQAAQGETVSLTKDSWWFIPALLLRNVFFLMLVLGHGFARVRYFFKG